MTQPPADGAVPPEAALFEIVGSGATAEEIAALTAVLAAVAGRRQNAAPAPGLAGASIWAGRSRLVRAPLAHAPGGWRASARPS
jgi:hypothetical protein